MAVQNDLFYDTFSHLIFYLTLLNLKLHTAFPEQHLNFRNETKTQGQVAEGKGLQYDI